MKRKPTLYLAGVLVVGVLGAVVVGITGWPFGELRDERAVVPPERLLMRQPVAVSGAPTWVHHRDDPISGATAPNLVRRWADQGRAPELTETVVRYSSSEEAADALGSQDPIGPVAEQFSVRPESAELPPGLHADDAEVACVHPEPPGCNIWIYWARYGQYTLALDYTNVDAGVRYQTFAAHVRKADRILTAAF